jgi:DNA-binding transcriptional MerR regulator
MAFFTPADSYVQPYDTGSRQYTRSRSPQNLGQVEIFGTSKSGTRTQAQNSHDASYNNNIITQYNNNNNNTRSSVLPIQDYNSVEYGSRSSRSPNRPVSPGLANDPFVQSFFAIDVDNTEEITIDELRAYAHKNNLSNSFLEKWVRLFDKDHSGRITFDEFCRVLGLKQSDIREMRRKTVQTVQTLPGDRRRFPAGVSVLSADLSEDKQYDIIFTMISYMEKQNERDASKMLKQYLDTKYGRLWHVVILIGQFWAFYSHEPACSLHFKIGRHIFLLFKTPGF